LKDADHYLSFFNRPRLSGLKNFVFVSSKDFLLYSKLYHGKTVLLAKTHLRLKPSVFLHLVEGLQAKASVFFDQYLTTVPY
jgi:hypothetical protein